MRIFLSLFIIALGLSAAIARPKTEIQNDNRNFITSKSNLSSKVAAGVVFGACAYVDDKGAPQCESTIESECIERLKGKWSEGKECPK